MPKTESSPARGVEGEPSAGGRAPYSRPKLFRVGALVELTGTVGDMGVIDNPMFQLKTSGTTFYDVGAGF